MTKVYHFDAGITDYGSCWQLQKKIHAFKQTCDCADIVITTEHNHVYTLGRTGDKNHLLINENTLKEKKISYYEIDRGGDLTYHGPGQLVCYPIFDLNHFYLDTHKYLRDLEETVILTLKNYGVRAHRVEEHTGVWVGNEKICAAGIKVSKWVTMHGIAFNINNDLEYFGGIIPCGIFHKGVTSMKKILGSEVDMAELSGYFIKNLETVFKIETERIDIDRLYEEFKLVSLSSVRNF
jgi:lipoyl(octanoyl) transferase